MPREFPDKISSNVKTKQGTCGPFSFSSIQQDFSRFFKIKASSAFNHHYGHWLWSQTCEPSILRNQYEILYLTVFIPGKSLIYSERLTTLLWSTLVCLNFQSNAVETRLMIRYGVSMNHRSGTAADKLEKAGFQNVAYLLNGLQKVEPGTGCKSSAVSFWCIFLLYKKNPGSTHTKLH